MSISKEYWENPDNPLDNGHVWICNSCGAHNDTQEWADKHICDAELIAEGEYWKDHYSKTIDGCSQDWDDPVLKIDLEPMKL